LWEEKRIFFATPQVVSNDLISGICPSKKIVLVVVDEAHKAQKNYAYCTVVQNIAKVSDNFRILGLSATPGSNIEQINNVIKNLRISNIELRDEDDEDVKKYLFDKNIVVMPIDLGDKITSIMELLKTLISTPIKRLCLQKVFFCGDINKITLTRLLAVYIFFLNKKKINYFRNKLNLE
jgi:fanconi anemia group M protein